MPFHASIAMCKAIVSSLCRTLAAEWSPNIRVNCISPSLVDTKMGSKFFRNEKQINKFNFHSDTLNLNDKKTIFLTIGKNVLSFGQFDGDLFVPKKVLV